MALNNKNRRLCKTTLLGMSVLIHILLIIVLAISNLTEKEKFQKIKLRVIKIAKVIKAKDKKSTKAKPKPKKKASKKTKRKLKKTSRKAALRANTQKVKTERMKKSVDKFKKVKHKTVKKIRFQKEPRVTTARKVKTAKMQKTATKVQKTTLQVVKKPILKAKKLTNRKLKEAKTVPIPKKMVQKKVSEVKPKKVTKVVQKRKVFKKPEKKIKRSKAVPKKITTAMTFKTQEQKVQKLKRKVVKQIKDIIRPQVTPKFTPKQQVVKKQIVEKKVIPDKAVEPVKKTFEIAKKLPIKIEQKVIKKKIEETRKNVKVRKVTPQKTTEFKVEKTKQQKVQKLNRVRQPVKITKRVTTKPRQTPMINQPQKLDEKQVIKKDAVKPLKKATPLRKKLVTKMDKQITPKIKQEKIPRKLETLMAVEKTKLAPTITTVQEEIVIEKPREVQETQQAVRRQVDPVTPAPVATPIRQEKPVMDTVPQNTKQIEKAVTTVKTTAKPVEKEMKFEVEKAVSKTVTPTQKAVTYQDKPTTQVSVREVSELEPMEEFSPEAQTAVTTSIATSARSATHVQSTMEESVVKVDLSQDEDLPISDQSKTFTQADMTTDEGEEGDVEGKIIQTERQTDGLAAATEFATHASAKPDFRGVDPSAAPSDRKGKGGSSKGGPNVSVNIPSGNMTNEQLFNLSGAIEGDMRGAFVTVNGNTQIAIVEDGQLKADITLVKGINEISVLAFNSGGGVGKRDFKLLYTPPQGVPTIILESPENGKQGARANDPVIVEGTIDDQWITKAKLLLNGVPIALKVKKGHFKRKIYLPETRVTTFRIMATGRNGQIGYSSLHTVLIGYDIDILNPRPY